MPAFALRLAEPFAPTSVKAAAGPFDNENIFCL
jgi:hypothetical protein